MLFILSCGWFLSTHKPPKRDTIWNRNYRTIKFTFLLPAVAAAAHKNTNFLENNACNRMFWIFWWQFLSLEFHFRCARGSNASVAAEQWWLCNGMIATFSNILWVDHYLVAWSLWYLPEVSSTERLPAEFRKDWIWSKKQTRLKLLKLLKTWFESFKTWSSKNNIFFFKIHSPSTSAVAPAPNTTISIQIPNGQKCIMSRVLSRAIHSRCPRNHRVSRGNLINSKQFRARLARIFWHTHSTQWHSAQSPHMTSSSI